MSKNGPLKVIELFAGVGGFRLGLENIKDKHGKPCYEFVWSNQWEPGARIQYASEIYEGKWGSIGHSCEDISTVKIDEIPNHDILVGGFPCQDYSVARTLNQAVGLVGKKGVLWWEIHRILKEKKVKPKYLLLENVDRLLRSPATQRGRDFAVMLASLAKLGYAVEWRVINAADYGFPQKRRRVFFLGYYKTTKVYKRMQKCNKDKKEVIWLRDESVINNAFPSKQAKLLPQKFVLEEDLLSVSDSFGLDSAGPVFLNAGFMIERNVFTTKVEASYTGKRKLLRDVLDNDQVVPLEFFVHNDDVEKWRFLKGAKKLPRKKKSNGFEYFYSEGSMPFPDKKDKPARTIVTGEGGSTPSRFKHIIQTDDGRYRRLTPVELERINCFPANHTNIAGISPIKRAFLMGNALVVGIVERLGKQLSEYV